MRRALFFAVCLAACGGGKSAPPKDPMMCERDPACSKARGAYVDCSKVCADESECMARCQQVQQGSDGLGH